MRKNCRIINLQTIEFVQYLTINTSTLYRILKVKHLKF